MKSNRIVFVTGLALFAMFFGAGNLIIPVMIGVNAGTQSWVSAIGFIASGVLLPALSMIALATKHPEEERFCGSFRRPSWLCIDNYYFLILWHDLRDSTRWRSKFRIRCCANSGE